jgi:glutamyl-tRNA synthetase
VPADIYMPDGTVAKGYCEPSVLDERNDELQFERFGFVKVESKDAKLVRAVFSHR